MKRTPIITALCCALFILPSAFARDPDKQPTVGEGNPNATVKGTTSLDSKSPAKEGAPVTGQGQSGEGTASQGGGGPSSQGAAVTGEGQTGKPAQSQTETAKQVEKTKRQETEPTPSNR